MSMNFEPYLEVAPNRRNKNNLPNDVKEKFNKIVASYQLIEDYEKGIISEKEFINKIRKL